jgi:hypothetical protein
MCEWCPPSNQEIRITIIVTQTFKFALVYRRAQNTGSLASEHSLITPVLQQVVHRTLRCLVDFLSPSRLSTSVMSRLFPSMSFIIHYFFYFLTSIPLMPYSYGVEVLFYSLDVYTIGRTPWTSDRPVARPLPKYRTIHRKNPCSKWDSNPRSQRRRERRQFMP